MTSGYRQYVNGKNSAPPHGALFLILEALMTKRENSVKSNDFMEADVTYGNSNAAAEVPGSERGRIGRAYLQSIDQKRSERASRKSIIVVKLAPTSCGVRTSSVWRFKR